MKIKEGQIKVALLCIGILILGVGIGLVINRPKTIPTLKSGEEVVAKIDGKEFTANDLYAKLKEEGGSTVVLNLSKKQIKFKPHFKNNIPTYEINIELTILVEEVMEENPNKNFF